MATDGDDVIDDRYRRGAITMTSMTSTITTTTTSSDSGFLRSLGMATATIVASFCVLALLWH